jgi:hypothetical protein
MSRLPIKLEIADQKSVQWTIEVWDPGGANTYEVNWKNLCKVRDAIFLLNKVENEEEK